MTKFARIGISILASGLLSAGLSGCQRTESTADNWPVEKGPAEQVGEHLDLAATEAAIHLNKIAEGAGKGLEMAGESLQKAAKDGEKKDVPATESRAQEIQK